MKLEEMGYDKKEIKKLKDHERLNLIYGDGSAVVKEEEPAQEPAVPTAPAGTFKLTPAEENTPPEEGEEEAKSKEEA